MKLFNRNLLLIGLLIIPFFRVNAQEEREELIPYGDLDQWIVREIHESGIIGGATKLLYEVGPTDTIVGNKPFENQGGSPWGNSNIYAKVAGISKTNQSVFQEKRGDGYCAKLVTRMEGVKVFGIIDIEVVAAGSFFLGKIHEPIRSTKNPQSMLLSGIPFTKRPKAIRYDYKTRVVDAPMRIRSTGFSRKSKVPGCDSIAVVLYLQKRWEEDGKIYAKRIGTSIQRFTTTTDDWVNNATFPILYGDITSHPDFKYYMDIQVEERYADNSKGESVPIYELGWAEADEQPTHMVLQFVTSHGGAYIGTPGNTMWIDNIRLVYQE